MEKKTESLLNEALELELGCTSQQLKDAISNQETTINDLKLLKKLLTHIKNFNTQWKGSPLLTAEQVKYLYIEYFSLINKTFFEITDPNKQNILLDLSQLFISNYLKRLKIIYIDFFSLKADTKNAFLIDYLEGIDHTVDICNSNLKICNYFITHQLTIKFNANFSNFLMVIKKFNFFLMLQYDEQNGSSHQYEKTREAIHIMIKYMNDILPKSDDEQIHFNFQQASFLLLTRKTPEEHQDTLNLLISDIRPTIGISNDNQEDIGTRLFYTIVLSYLKKYRFKHSVSNNNEKLSHIQTYLKTCQDLLNLVNEYLEKSCNYNEYSISTFDSGALALCALHAMRLTKNIMENDTVTLLSSMEKNDSTPNHEWEQCLRYYADMHSIFSIAKNACLSLKFMLQKNNFWLNKAISEDFSKFNITYLQLYADNVKKSLLESLPKEKEKQSATIQNTNNTLIISSKKENKEPDVTKKPIKEKATPESPISIIATLVSLRNYSGAVKKCHELISNNTSTGMQKAEAHYYIALCTDTTEQLSQKAQKQFSISFDFLLDMSTNAENSKPDLDKLLTYLHFLYPKMSLGPILKENNPVEFLISKEEWPSLNPNITIKSKTKILDRMPPCHDDKTFLKIVGFLNKYGDTYLTGSAALHKGSFFRDFDLVIFGKDREVIYKLLQSNAEKLGITELKELQKHSPHLYFECAGKLFNLGLIQKSNLSNESILEENASQRFTTTNAVFYDTKKKKMLDSVNGAVDFDKKIINIVNGDYTRAVLPKNLPRLIDQIIREKAEDPKWCLPSELETIVINSQTPLFQDLHRDHTKTYFTHLFFDGNAHITFPVLLTLKKMDSIVWHFGELTDKSLYIFSEITSALAEVLNNSYKEFKRHSRMAEMKLLSKYFYGFLLWPLLQIKLNDAEYMSNPEKCMEDILTGQNKHFPETLPSYFITDIKKLWLNQINKEKTPIYNTFRQIIESATNIVTKKEEPKISNFNIFNNAPNNNDNNLSIEGNKLMQ